MYMETRVILDNAKRWCVGLSGLRASSSILHRGLQPRQRIWQPFGLKTFLH